MTLLQRRRDTSPKDKMLLGTNDNIRSAVSRHVWDWRVYWTRCMFYSLTVSRRIVRLSIGYVEKFTSTFTLLWFKIAALTRRLDCSVIDHLLYRKVDLILPAHTSQQKFSQWSFLLISLQYSIRLDRMIGHYEDQAMTVRESCQPTGPGCHKIAPEISVRSHWEGSL